MKPYPDCNHNDCHRYGNKLFRPWSWLSILAGVVIGLAIVGLSLLSAEAIGMVELTDTQADVAFGSGMLPLVMAVIISVSTRRHDVVTAGWNLLQLVAVIGLLAYLVSLRLVSDYVSLLAEAGAEPIDKLRYSWLVIATLAGLGPAISLLVLTAWACRGALADQEKKVASQCPGSHDSDAVAVG